MGSYMKILLCGGGTGGHITPALAIAEYFSEHYKGAEILFVGRRGGAENAPIIEKGYKLCELEIGGIERKLSIKNFHNLLLAIKALRKSGKIIKETAPDAVMGTGGYVSWPVIRAAQLRKVPTYIHESNAAPGLVTKLLSTKCRTVFLNSEEALQNLKRKDNAELVGNPVRKEFLCTDRNFARKKLGVLSNEFLIISLGGSGGSARINEVIADMISKYSSKRRDIKHFHATGRKHFEAVSKKLKKNSNVLVAPYFNDMPMLLNACDVVISRSGAMTLAEITAAEAASILIPSPNVTGDHQLKNAKSLEKRHGAIIIEEKELNADILIREIEELKSDTRKRNALRINSRKCFKADAEKAICETVIRDIEELDKSKPARR